MRTHLLLKKPSRTIQLHTDRSFCQQQNTARTQHKRSNSSQSLCSSLSEVKNFMHADTLNRYAVVLNVASSTLRWALARSKTYAASSNSSPKPACSIQGSTLGLLSLTKPPTYVHACFIQTSLIDTKLLSCNSSVYAQAIFRLRFKTRRADSPVKPPESSSIVLTSIARRVPVAAYRNPSCYAAKNRANTSRISTQTLSSSAGQCKGRNTEWYCPSKASQRKTKSSRALIIDIFIRLLLQCAQPKIISCVVGQRCNCSSPANYQYAQQTTKWWWKCYPAKITKPITSRVVTGVGLLRQSKLTEQLLASEVLVLLHFFFRCLVVCGVGEPTRRIVSTVDPTPPAFH